MKKHFVEFFSPGTFFAETTVKPIDDWNVDQAIEMSHDITERHDSKPYGFQFFTRERGPDDLNSHVTERSGMYYLAGKIEALEEIEKRNDPEERILRNNMRHNGWDRVITSNTPWRWTQPFRDGDSLVIAE